MEPLTVAFLMEFIMINAFVTVERAVGERVIGILTVHTSTCPAGKGTSTELVVF